MALGSIIKELLIAGGTAAAKAIVRALRGKAEDGWVDVKVTDPPQPLSHKDVEHQQRQIADATSHGTVQGPDRNATTVRPGRPKPGTLR
jgi:hypothetical protein